MGRFNIPNLGRALGVDYGNVRIGLALSDPTGTIATPIDAIKTTGPDDPVNIASLASEQKAMAIIVGLPLSLDGSVGKSARKVKAFCSRLRNLTELPVITWDERMSTLEAHNLLRATGKTPSKERGMNRGKIDSASAAIILNSYIQSK